MGSAKNLSIHQKWLIAFGLWLAFLSGGFASFVGSPGILQALRLKSLLESKKENLSAMNQELSKIQNERNLLENSRSAQIREIRRVLGYTAPDEIVFDFNSPDQF